MSRARNLPGGVQVTVDLAGAFDPIPRQQLLRGMQEIGLLDRVVGLVMRVTVLNMTVGPGSSRLHKASGRDV